MTLPTFSHAAWLRAVVLADHEPYRDRLSLDQLLRVEIASRRGPERLSVADAGEMVAIWAGVVGG
jgi:hypothetical protein